MIDKSYDQILAIHFLELQEVHQLVSDMLGEFMVENIHMEVKRPIFAWHLRYFHYLPFSLISNVLSYSSSWAAADSVRTFMSGCEFSPISMVGEPSIEVLRILSSEYYDSANNIYIDRVSNTELINALLKGASDVCGYMDRPSKTGWFQFTPKDSTMLNAFDIKNRSLTLTEISADYEIKRIS